MSKVLHTATEVAELIKSGKTLALAGDQSVLAKLPRGSWIGGTTPYFIGDAGGTCSRDLIHVTDMPPGTREVRIARYDAHTIDRVYEDGATADFSLIMIPAQSATHLRFALHAPSFSRFAHRPLIGWITGLHLDDLVRGAAQIIDGQSGDQMADGALVMHVRLPDTQVAELDIVNIFETGDGPEVQFARDGFEAREAVVGGETVNLARWLDAQKADTRLPLVANYLGTNVNVSFQSVDPVEGVVRFYAPVFAGVPYHHAKPVGDYVSQFSQRIPSADGRIAFSCNCILNYVHSHLQGKRTGNFSGPITFGEVAYQLLNQTMAYLTISDRSGSAQ
jgi:hypothetical protein